MNTYDIAIVVGSNRRDSINRKLSEALAKLAGPSMQCRWVQIDDLPMYNADLEPERILNVIGDGRHDRPRSLSPDHHDFT